MVKFLTEEEGFRKITLLASNSTPFLFIISYDKSQIFVEELSRVPDEIKYSLEHNLDNNIGKRGELNRYPIDFKSYLKSFKEVIKNIEAGNTYLFNLTFKSKIETNLNLKDIFFQAKAPYKLYIEDSFVCFSPESFVKIEDDVITTYPMKGTIDADIPDAKERILSNEKELAEHIMIVDLLRNDLNIIGDGTKVTNFRYTNEIEAGQKRLIQVSSKIEAKLPTNWRENLGDILNSITPAGSVTGTPKKMTVKLINEIENDKRGFYTGIFGIFDGKNLDSGVMIRAITKEGSELFYHSGGGITIDSKAEDEYQEMIDKIYLPT
jgi:para-aminobenzoate synthetase component 1